MSAPDHCRHCAGAPGKSFIACGGPMHANARGALWLDGDCPACDQAERIAQLCDEEAATAGPERLPDHDARAQTWQAAANLARGRR